MNFTKKDFKLEWFSGSGSGGQHRNKHQNCCRITHIESGLTATGQNSRSRVENQRSAFKSLAQKILAYYQIGESENERIQTDAIVRTYHFERNIVSDGIISSDINSVIDGNIDSFIENALKKGRPLRKTGRV